MGVNEGATPYMNTKFTSTPVIDKQTFMRDYRDCMLRLGIPMSTVHVNAYKNLIFDLLRIRYESGVQKYLETIQQMKNK